MNIGPYRDLEEIGRGGMGVVYKARDSRNGRTVAIKRIQGLASRSQTARLALVREAGTTAELKHKNIVTVFDVGQQEGVLFIVMEYLQGHTLSQVTVTTSPRSMALLGLPTKLSPNWLWSVILFALLTLPRSKRIGAIVLGLTLVLLPCGCGGSSSSSSQNPTGTAAGTYNLKVVAKSGAVSQSITLTLVVQ
jgi:hypothetical protein